MSTLEPRAQSALSTLGTHQLLQLIETLVSGFALLQKGGTIKQGFQATDTQSRVNT